MCELKSERNFESMPLLNYKSVLIPMFEHNHRWFFFKLIIISNRPYERNSRSQHTGNLCLASGLIYCAHRSSIYVCHYDLETLTWTLTQCHLGGYKTEYIGVFERQTLNISGIAYCLVLNCEIHQKLFIYVYLQFKSEFKYNYLASTSLNFPLNVCSCKPI